MRRKLFFYISMMFLMTAPATAGTIGDVNGDDVIDDYETYYSLAVPTGGITVTLLIRSAPVPKTGQHSCWNQVGDSVDCTGRLQDGAIQAGTAWSGPRFTDNGDGTVTDHLTGLMWLADANFIETAAPYDPSNTGDGSTTWHDALDFVDSLTYAGNSTYAMKAYFSNNSLSYSQKTNDGFVWPVRGGN